MKKETRIFSQGVMEFTVGELEMLASLVEMALDGSGITFAEWAEINIRERHTFSDEEVGPFSENDMQRVLDRLNHEYKVLKG